MDNKVGYFAIDRRIFDNPILKNPRWFVAWQRLLAAASWKDEGARLSAGFAKLKRGQIAFTIRGLAKSWGWSPTGVEYFLGRLEKQKMVVRKIIRTETQAESGTSFSYLATVLTICNYDKYQQRSKSAGKSLVQGLEQSLVQSSPQLPGIVVESEPNHFKQTTKRKTREQRANERFGQRKPPHGARANGVVWFDYATFEWKEYARDYLEVVGADKFPENRIGGMGNWFYIAGQASRKKSA